MRPETLLSRFLYYLCRRMTRHLKYKSALALVLFAFFFASTNLFPHVHEGPEGRIVHSHPWSGKAHSHSDSEIQLLQIITANIYLDSGHVEFVTEESRSFPVIPVLTLPEVVQTVFHHVLGLRAPPVSL